MWGLIRRFGIGSEGGLSGAAFLLAVSAFGSQILGLVRDRLLATRFGAGADLDVYYLSFKIPDFIFLTVGSMFAAVVVIPLLHRQKDARHFFGELLALAGVMLGASALAAFAFMPVLIAYLAPGFTQESRELAVTLARVLLASPILLAVSALCGSALQSRRIFFAYALAPILYNAGIIAGIVLLAPRYGITGVVYGVVIGAALHLLVQLPALARIGYLHSPHLPSARDLAGLFSAALPRTLSLAAQSLAGFVMTSLATLAGTGSVASFQFAHNLQAIPLSLVGVTFSTAALPVLSELFVAERYGEFRGAVLKASRSILMLSLAATAAFLLFSDEIVRVIFGLKPGLALSADRVALLLRVFAVSIAAQGLVLLLVRAYHAAGRPWIPLLTAFAGALSAIALALAFGARQTFADPVVGLAVAVTGAHLIQMVLLASHFLATFRHEQGID